MCFTYQV